MKLIEGQIIHGRYRLDERIAKGGMGEVWRATDMVLNHEVAVKALRSDLINDSSRLERLRTEAHNSANLAHPNIAALFEYYEHDNFGFLVMEFLHARSLADIYKERKRIPTLELLPIIEQVARGLHLAHAHGVIHRDVKPGNIMVSDQGLVKITDFGVSYSTNQAQITQDGMVVGTAQYISPEQAQGEHATPQSDIYSLGVVLYEGLAGHRPFTGATPVDIAAAQVNDPVPPLPHDLDPELVQYVMQMLEKDPHKRPTTAVSVATRLSQIENRLIRQENGEEDYSVSPAAHARTSAPSSSSASSWKSTFASAGRLSLVNPFVNSLGDSFDNMPNASDEQEASQRTNLERGQSPYVSAPFVANPLVSNPFVSSPDSRSLAPAPPSGSLSGVRSQAVSRTPFVPPVPQVSVARESRNDGDVAQWKSQETRQPHRRVITSKPTWSKNVIVGPPGEENAQVIPPQNRKESGSSKRLSSVEPSQQAGERAGYSKERIGETGGQR